MLPLLRPIPLNFSPVKNHFHPSDEINCEYVRSLMETKKRKRNEKKDTVANGRDNFNAAGQDGKLEIFWRFVDRWKFGYFSRQFPPVTFEFAKSINNVSASVQNFASR